MKITSRGIALSAVSAAFAVIFLVLGAYIDVLDISCLFMASLALMLPLTKGFYLGAFLAYIASGILGFVLTGTFRLILPFAAFFGLHPIVNQLQKKFGINRWLALAIKTLWFAGVMALCYFFTSMFVFENEFLKTYGVYIVIIGGALIFPFYDAIMTRFQYSVNAIVAQLKL